MWRVFVLVMLACSTAGVTGRGALTDAERALLLAHHNALRAGEGAADMRAMVWGDDVAYMAQEWADTCKWYHGQPDGHALTDADLGQNTWFSTLQEGATRVESITAATRAWFNEKEFYTYHTGACSAAACGHYTQMVWATSHTLGCGYAICPQLYGDKEDPARTVAGVTDAHVLVCNYWPSGNSVGKYPFERGASCTKCPSGYFSCKHGLCLGVDHSLCQPQCSCEGACENGGTLGADCRCHCAAGFKGADCSRLCGDTSAYCRQFDRSYCQQGNANYGFMRRECQGTCKLCEGTYDGPAFARASANSDRDHSGVTPPPSDSGAAGSTRPPAADSEARAQGTTTSADGGSMLAQGVSGGAARAAGGGPATMWLMLSAVGAILKWA